MSYNAYVLILSQLASKKKAQITIQDRVVYVEDQPEYHRWQVSTKIFNAEGGAVSWPARHCISSQGVMRWQERGAYLKLDPETKSVFLIQEIESSKKYIPFKSILNDFIEVAGEWAEILEEFSDKESLARIRR